MDKDAIPNTCTAEFADINDSVGKKMHSEYFGVPGQKVPLWKSMDGPSGNGKPRVYTVSGLSGCSSETCNPFSLGIEKNHLVLSTEVTRSSAEARIKINGIPMPDAIYSGRALDVSAPKLLKTMLPDSVRNKMAGTIGRETYAISDSVVLYYVTTNQPFYLKNDLSNQIVTSAVHNHGSFSTEVLMFASQPFDLTTDDPKCSKMGPHDGPFNELLRYKGQITDFQLTGDISATENVGESAARFMFAQEVLYSRCTPPYKSIETTSCGIVVRYDGDAKQSPK